MPARIGRPITRSSTRKVGDSMIAASRPWPSSGDFHSLTFLGLLDPAGAGAATAMFPPRSCGGVTVTGPSPHRHGRIIRAGADSLLGDVLQLGLQVLEGVGRALRAGQGRVGGVLDGRGGVAVARPPSAAGQRC